MAGWICIQGVESMAFRFVTHLLCAGVGAAAFAAAPSLAVAQEGEEEIQEFEAFEVTGSRILRPNEFENSPTLSVDRDDITRQGDVTLDTYINTLPQVNPAGTITSNNPGNNGQASVDLRGLGSNRNLVLIDGRRAMVSNAAQTVDVNTIPQALIESIEVYTGGAGAVYGADAVAGALNIRLRKDFEGVEFNAVSSDTFDSDAYERQYSGLIGGNFADGRGNAVFGFDYADREGLIKSQRDFAAVATATTSFLPEGSYLDNGNAPSQAAVDSVFGGYGVAAGAVSPGLSLIGFNLDGTLFSRGVFNSNQNVENFRYPVDLSVNTNLFPDLYSFNFDAVNILRLPLTRRSFMSKFDFDVTDDIEVFASASWADYESLTALAPSPVPTVLTRAPGEANFDDATSPLVAPNGLVIAALVVPTSNPFIPNDLQTLLASRTGDDPSLVGSGATEPFLLRQRTLDAGLRSSLYENTVVQYLAGANGPLYLGDWRWEAYLSEGRTTIDQTQSGNIDTSTVAGADRGA